MWILVRSREYKLYLDYSIRIAQVLCAMRNELEQAWTVFEMVRAQGMKRLSGSVRKRKVVWSKPRAMRRGQT